MAKERNRELRQYPLGPDMGYEADYFFQREELSEALTSALSELQEAVVSRGVQDEKQQDALTRYQQYNTTVRFLANTYPKRFNFFRGGEEADPVEQRLINTTNYLATRYREQGSYQAPIFLEENFKGFAVEDQAIQAEYNKEQAPMLGIPVAVFLVVGIGVAMASPVGGAIICGFAGLFLIWALIDYFSDPPSREQDYEAMTKVTNELVSMAPSRT